MPYQYDFRSTSDSLIQVYSDECGITFREEGDAIYAAASIRPYAEDWVLIAVGDRYTAAGQDLDNEVTGIIEQARRALAAV